MISERVITVEYLDPSMSRDLLCKFPDDSAFDFDYSQSGIWSPLLPRGRHPSFCDSPPKKRRRIAGKVFEEKLKMVDLKIKKGGKKAYSKKGSDVSASSAQGSTARKGWGERLLRAASKRFRKHKGSTLQINLPM